MDSSSAENEIDRAISLLRSIQDGINRWKEEPQENAHELGKAVKDRETTARRIVELCARDGTAI